MRFVWDERKASANLANHVVDVLEAVTVFGDALAQTMPDPDHSIGESRFLTMGLSSLVVAHSEADDEIRVISARVASKSERRNYES